jgi:hypothetical protein
VAPPVFKTALLSQAAKIANKTLGFSRPADIRIGLFG